MNKPDHTRRRRGGWTLLETMVAHGLLALIMTLTALLFATLSRAERNAVRAGVIDTEVHKGHGEDRLRTLMAMVPMKRMGQPEEVAAAVVWLLSAEASYVTGAILDVTGGL